MHPAFASIQKELKDLDAYIEKSIEQYLEQGTTNDDDYDPHSIFDDIKLTIDGFLQGLEHHQEGLPSRTDEDLEAHDDLNRSVKALIRRAKHQLIEIDYPEHYLDDWFTGYLAPTSYE